MDASQLESMNPADRITATQANAVQASDASRDETIADVSHYGSMGAGLGLAARGGWVGVASFAAAVGGAYLGSELARITHADEFVEKGLEAVGMHQIATGGPKASTVDHQVAHSFAFAGFLAAVAIGVLAAVATAALIVATGGVAAVALIGAAAAGGLTAGFLGGAVSGALSHMGSETGPIKTGSPNTLINSKAVARMTDLAACSKESAPTALIEGCKNIFVNSLPMVRVGHKLACGATVDQGSANVTLNNTVVACAQPASEIPLGARVAADWIGFLPLGKAAAFLGKRYASTASAEMEGSNAAANKVCKSDPVDVATGEFVEVRTDLAIAGVLSIALKRNYSSNHIGPAKSLFGSRWSDSFSTCLIRKGDTITYWDEEGVGLVFDTPREQLNASHLAAPDFLLQGSQKSPVLFDQSKGCATYFGWQGDIAYPVKIEDFYGNYYNFIYLDQRLRRIEHSQGHYLEFLWSHTAGNSEVATPHSLSSILLQQPGLAAVELVRYEFDQQGRLIASQSQQSGKLFYRYDAADRITQWGDATLTNVTLTYHEDGRVAEVVTPGKIYNGRFEYDTEQRRTRVWIDGQASHYDYNEHNLVVASTNPLGQTTHVTWNACRRKTSETDRRGRTTQFEYDAIGRLGCVIDFRGRRTALEYDAVGRVGKMIQADGREQSWEYDPGGRVISAVASDGTTTRNSFDRNGRLIAHTAADGAVTRYEYDVNGNPCASIAANGARRCWRQDVLGQVTESTDGVRQTTRYQYAQLQEAQDSSASAPWVGSHTAPTRIMLPTGDCIEYEYNREGLITQVTDAAGGKVHYAWGAYDLLAAKTDQRGQTMRYEYDSYARLHRIVNSQGETWRFTYDAAGQLIEEIDFTQKTIRYQYDAAGRLCKKVVADWLNTYYVWDDAERLASIKTDDREIQYEYDKDDRLVSARRLDGERIESELRWKYDKLGRVTNALQDGKEIAWEYDAVGRRTARHTPTGSSRHTHGMFGLLNSLHTASGDVFIDRDLLGREIGRSSISAESLLQATLQPAPEASLPPSHFSLQQQYDAVGRLLAQQIGAVSSVKISISDTLVPLRSYRWQQGRLTGIDDSRFGDVHYTNDVRNQIVHADYRLNQAYRSSDPKLARETFVYDSLGNISARDSSSPDQQVLQARALQQSYTQSKVTHRGNISYRYDRAGRMIERTEQVNGFRAQTYEFYWDGFDRMTGVRTATGEVWHYTYDALGRRTGKRCVDFGQERRRNQRLQQEIYLWDGPNIAVQWKTYADGRSEAPAVRDDSGLRTKTLTWHHDPGTFKPLAVSYQRNESTPELLHLVTDHLGSPREAVKNNGEVVWAMQLQTWGGVNQKWNKTGGSPSDPSGYTAYRGDAANDVYVDLDLRLPNQWEDEETGLFYNCHRYYDPQTGHYISSDPVGLMGGGRSHGYVENPVTWMDPLGLTGCGDTLYRTMKPNENGDFVESPLTGSPNANQKGARTPSSNPKHNDFPTGLGPDDMVGPSHTGTQGLSSSLTPLEPRPGQVNGKVQAGDLPEGLGALNDHGDHVSIHPTSDMPFSDFQTLLNQVPWAK